MTRYFAHISAPGPIRYGRVPGSIGVLEALDKFMPIGEASCRTWVENGLGGLDTDDRQEGDDGEWAILNRVIDRLT